MKSLMMEKHLLCVSYHSTLPQNTGANVRMRNLLLNLSEMNPILLAPEPMDSDLSHRAFIPFHVPSWMRRIVGFNASILGCHGNSVYRRARRVLSDVEFSAVQCEHLWSFPLSRRIARARQVPLILIEHNIETVYSERAYRVPLLAKAISLYERRALTESDRVVVCSEEDGVLLTRRFGIPYEKIWVVPNGIQMPLNVTGQATNSIPEPLRNKTVILFLGKTNYPPNVEAIRIIRDELVPRAQAQDPNLVFTIVGGPREADYSRVRHGLAFTGFVEDLEPLLQYARVCIAPLISGSGTRLKILEYAAYAKPIVATSMAVEGLRLTDKSEILISDDWGEFFGTILSLAHGNLHPAELGQNAYKRVAEEYQWKSIAARYEQLLLELVDSLGDQPGLTARRKIGNQPQNGKGSLHTPLAVAEKHQSELKDAQHQTNISIFTKMICEPRTVENLLHERR